MKKKKLKSLRSLHKKAWNFMSSYIRLRDKGICITCSKKGAINEMHAGHFVHVRSMDFLEENISCQCPFCNTYRHGELGEYALALDKKYGLGTAERLLSMKHTIHKFTRNELEEIIQNLTDKIALLMTEKVNELLK